MKNFAIYKVRGRVDVCFQNKITIRKLELRTEFKGPFLFIWKISKNYDKFQQKFVIKSNLPLT